MNRILWGILGVNVVFILCLYGSKTMDRGGTSSVEDVFKLRVYEATMRDDVARCGQDAYCQKHMRYFKSMLCIDQTCHAADQRQQPIDCAPAFAALYPRSQQQRINHALCALIDNPGPRTRHAYLSLVVNETEGEAVELGGYLMALKGSASACQQYIKDFVGPWGKAWTFQWSRALAGCRILAKERTRDQESKDLNTWIAVAAGVGQCADISNTDMQRACAAAGATPPIPAYEQLW